MRIAYLDCFSGISGDMFLGALIDVGVPASLFEKTVAELNAAGHLDARLAFKKVDRSGISATKVDVILGGKSDEPRVEHHHYKEHHHGHTHEHAHEQVLGHTHGGHASVGVAEAAEHVSGEMDSHGSHQHRGLKEIREIITRADISGTAKERALGIFQALGAAEAKIHNVPIEQIHFHEVGAADAIVDIVCAAVGSEALQVDEWVCSPLNLGAGTIECAHGSFPVPAPATAELLSGAAVFSSGIQAELVTPTGAAIVKTLASRFSPLPGMKIARIGYGAGTCDFSRHANVLRILIGESGEAARANDDTLLSISAPQETVCVLEAEMDDLNPQIFAYVVEQVLAQGALDAFGAPVQMKKNRSGMLLTILTKPADASRLAELIFRESSTLGIRVREERRMALPRSFQLVQTRWGEVRMKIAMLNGEVSNYAPEYEDCRRIAEQRGIALKQVMQEAVRAYLLNVENQAEQANVRASKPA